MARIRFRDRFFTPPVGRALSSPWSILLLGGVTAGAIVAGIAAPIAGVLGAAAYGARVLFAMPRKERGERIDPFVLREPWRGYVKGAQSSKLRFDRTVESTRPGPLHDRLSELSSRLDDGIQESWRIACRGDDIDRALSQLDTREAEVELAQLKAQAADPASSGDLAETIESLEAQLNSAERMRKVSTSTRNRLRLLDARFDELVARAVEVSIGSGDSGVLGNDVDDLVTELESLRLAIDDTAKAEDGAAAPSSSALGQEAPNPPELEQPSSLPPVVEQTRPTEQIPEQRPSTRPPE
jgi:hypothetical protein